MSSFETEYQILTKIVVPFNIPYNDRNLQIQIPENENYCARNF